MNEREREYTPEEAYALTMREAIPNWYGSTPLVVGVDLPDGAYPQPLDHSISSGTWVFVFVSATGAEFSRVKEIYLSWLKRFRPLGIHFVFSFRGHYSFYRERKGTELWVNSLGFETPVVGDLNGSLAKAFGAIDEPAVAIIHSGKLIFTSSGTHWTNDFERHLHFVLREDSPGLPLWRPIRSEGSLRRTIDRWLLRKGHRSIASKQVELEGKWEISEDRIVTADPTARLSFVAPASGVTFVGRSLNEAGEDTRIRFESEGGSLFDHFSGPDFQFDGDGSSGFFLGRPRAYDVLRDLTPPFRKLSFQFQFAKSHPVAIYGLEFGDPAGV